MPTFPHQEGEEFVMLFFGHLSPLKGGGMVDSDTVGHSHQT
jgi:hypothetical protein